jgi:thiol-disulfide isomerase/thioredoxin
VRASFRSLSVLAPLAALLALSACADQALTQQVTDLETRVKALEEKSAKAPAAAAPGAAANDPEQEAAMNIYKEAADLSAQGKTEEAKAKLTELTAQYGKTRAGQAGARLLAELSVVGKDISELKVEEWYVGNATLADSKATLVVFWEVWCPHCKREVPKLQATFDTYKSQGLGVIGLTKLTRGKTVDEVKAFITETKVSYPMGKEAGDMSEFFGVSGVPAAAVVKSGKVVWRGHPAQVTEDMIKGWIN